MRYLLWPFAALFGLIVRLRNLCYDKGWCAATSFDVPVIVVGNLSVGGTGKSPMTVYLARLLQQQRRVAILSRGYGRTTKGFRWVNKGDAASDCGDEPLQYTVLLDNVTVAVCEDRRLGIETLLKMVPAPEVILLDDAYQHRAVKGGFSVLLTEAAMPYSRDYLLPMGRLREPRGGAERADVVVVTKCEGQQDAAAWRNELALKDKQQLCFSYIRYRDTLSLLNGGEIPVSHVKEWSVFLLSGIANPAPLEAHLTTVARKFESVRFGDHHRFTVNELRAVKDKFDKFASGEQSAVIVTTRKDSMRIVSDPTLAFVLEWPIAVLDIEVELADPGKAGFDKTIVSYVDAAHSRVG